MVHLIASGIGIRGVSRVVRVEERFDGPMVRSFMESAPLRWAAVGYSLPNLDWVLYRGTKRIAETASNATLDHQL